MSFLMSKYKHNYPYPWGNFLRDLYGDMNQLLQDHDKFHPNMTSNETEQWSPHVDIRENAENFVIDVELPGIDPKDVEISIENNALTIKGIRTIERDLKKENYSRIERFSGSFYRQFTLPDHVNTDQIKASGKNGVICILVPKQQAHKPPKKISVETLAE